jgi:hypothetical protein
VLEVAANGGAELPLHLRGQEPGVYLLSSVLWKLPPALPVRHWWCSKYPR